MRSIAPVALAALLAACATEPVPPPPLPLPPEPAAAPAPLPEPAPAPAPEPPPPPPEHPVQMEDGPWRVGVVSEHKRKYAVAYCQVLEGYHLKTAIETVTVKGVQWERVVLPGLGTEAEAKEMVTYLADKLGIKTGWVVPLGKRAAARGEPPAPVAPPVEPAPAAAPAEPTPRN